MEFIIVKRKGSTEPRAYNEQSGCANYALKHGAHFTDELAEYASQMMVNNSGERHAWTAQEVKNALTSDTHIPSDITIGDITYLANMYYADLYPTALATAEACIKAAILTANDPDGYEGMAFYRWLTDIEHRLIDIDWNKFI